MESAFRAVLMLLLLPREASAFSPGIGAGMARPTPRRLGVQMQEDLGAQIATMEQQVRLLKLKKELQELQAAAPPAMNDATATAVPAAVPQISNPWSTLSMPPLLDILLFLAFAKLARPEKKDCICR